MYRPLIKSLTIKESIIEDLGLFAVEFIPKFTYLGVSHIELETGLIRTPLGGFYNHSNTPNCEKRKMGNIYNLVTLRDIEEGEEITVKYTFYKI